MRRAKSDNRLNIFLLVTVPLGLSGCATNHYGGHTFEVVISPPPTQAQSVFLIPDEVWTTYAEDFSSKADPAERAQRLVEYKVGSDGKKRVDAIKYDVVVDAGNGLVVRKQIVPSTPGQTIDVTP